MYDLGDPVDLQVQIKNPQNVLENATTVVVTIALPDGTVATPAVTNPSPGVYTISYSAVQVGRHSVQWLATGVNRSAFTDVFDVRSAVSIQLFSLADARSILHLTKTINDEELRGWIDSVTSVVERKVGPVVPRSISEHIYARHGIILSYPPIISVESITPTYTGGWVVAVNQVDVDSETGIVSRLDRGQFWGDWYTVTYTAGRRIVPAAISEAGRIILKNLWALERAQTRQPSQGGDDQAPQTGQVETMIPYRAQTLLDPYRLPGAAA